VEKNVGVNRKFCSNRCQGDFTCSERNKIVVATGDLGKAFKGERAIREYLLKTLPNQCAICQNIEWKKQPIPLVMDHIDGDSENRSITNLRLICPNCDAQTSTYKGRNRGRGRSKRRERYRTGKSY